MDSHLDTSWCPACAREIVPKRFMVPVAPPPPPAPAPPPSSPSSSSPPKAQTGDATAARITRTKTGTIRTRGGLVHGTGRVKPNGAVKRSNSATVVKGEQAAAPASVQPVAPLKRRTIIDQGPIPLYCSDECRMSDFNSVYGVLSLNHDPHREPTSTDPHNSYASITSGCEAESESSGGVSSAESYSSISQSSLDSARASRVSHSIATLATLYDFPPLPPPPPIIEQADSQSSASDSEYNFDQYQSGVMMAARRIQAALCPEPVKRSAFNPAPPTPSRKPIPGWTDGSDAWRTSVYSLSAPKSGAQASGVNKVDKAYTSIVASPHHSRGIHSTISETSPLSSHHNVSTSSLPVTRPTAPVTTRSTSYAGELYSKYPLSISRRSESRTSLITPGSFPTTSVSSCSQQRQGRSLLKPGAEGKLLVPDVKLKVHARSSLSPSVASSASLTSWGSSYPASSRRGMRSLLSRHGSEISEGGLSDQCSRVDPDEWVSVTKRPAVETRSWSYDNIMTYPVMHPAVKKEKRIQTQVVNGVEQQVEVEVEVSQPFKRLFLFSDKDASV